MPPAACAPSQLLADVAGLRRFVLSIARRYQVSARLRGVSDEDLVNTGFVGLCKAARRYDAGRASFRTWGSYWIRAEIREHLQQTKPLSTWPAAEGGVPVDVKAPPSPELGQRLEVEALLGVLTARERRAVELRYGLVDGQERTLAEVGVAFGQSGEAARLVLVLALGKMQKARKRLPSLLLER